MRNEKKPTHYLHCRHCVGLNCVDYDMRCILLKITKNGKAKIILFGERFWRYCKDKKSIRYVDFKKLEKIKHIGELNEK